jgi:DtxR family Mn-dependent transcriptional regulator
MRNENLSNTLENYMKVIGELIKTNGEARVKDIAEKLNVKLPTVTLTLKVLADKGLIEYKPYHHITFTESGKEIADKLLNKKIVLVNFLMDVLNISREDAEKISCEMEHSISDDNLKKFKDFLIFVDNCPYRTDEIKNKFKDFISLGGDVAQNCENCLKSCMEDFLKNNLNYTDKDTTTLNKLKIGDKAKIIKIKKNPLLAKRFCEMGGVSGTIVKIEKIAPLGDPISLKIKGTEISIRKEEAENIIVEKIY